MKNSLVPVVVLSCVLILVCCCCLLLAVSFGLISTTLFWDYGEPYQVVGEMPEITPAVLQPTPFLNRPEESLEPVPMEILDTPDTLDILVNAEVPINDLLDLAQRFGGTDPIPVALDPVTEALQLGTQETFWVSNADTEENFQVETVLQYVTDHAYYWIEQGIRFKEKDLEALALVFEEQIYPTDRALFGSEWSPGVDGDQHLSIIYARGLGDSLAGYFSSADEYHPLAHEYSNMKEAFVLNADTTGLDEAYTYGVLAHEFQHMIHWYQDRNETTWLNEGLSELAAFINGYDIGGFDYLYASNPDLQLNHWANEHEDTAHHYGASFLFVNYFYDRFGSAAVRDLVAAQENDLDSLDAILSVLGEKDGFRGEVMGADDVFIDWALTNYLQDDRIFDGRYAYQNYPNAPQAVVTETFDDCPLEPVAQTVHQYGVDYLRFSCQGDFTLRFEGMVDVGVLPVDPYSGDFGFWSNYGDDSDMTLTRSFDFREVTGPLTLSYWTWYDLEEDYDYLYLVVSSDGLAWQILTTPSGTMDDPSGNSFGWGYNGLSGGDGRWIQEQVDLSQFAGQQVQVRFEYVTDGAVTGEGFWIDDIAIPEIGYFTDFETGADGWEGAGFVRIQNTLPQTFRLALIERRVPTQVTYIQLGEDNVIEIPLHIQGWNDEAILVVSGTTRFTRQLADYVIEVYP